MSSSSRDEIIFGFTEKEVKLLIMSLKCIETHGNRRFLNCERLAQLTGYSSAEAYEYYMNHLLQKVIALPPVDLARGSDDQNHTDIATAAFTPQVATSAVGEDGKKDSGADRDDNMEKSQAKEDVYRGIGDGVDGAGGDPEDEKELEALGSAYAWDC